MGLGGLTSAVLSGAEFGRRRFSLLTTASTWVEPRAAARPEPLRTLLILQRGPNPSTDYYLKPRVPAGATARVAELSERPDAVLRTLQRDGLWVVACRYMSERWLAALERLRPARFAFFADDDLPGMQLDRTATLDARGKVAAHYGRFVERLSELVTDVWLSTPAVAAAYPYEGAQVIGPVPEADPPTPTREVPRRVVYHGAGGHWAERRFVLEVARQLAARAPDVTVEVTGDARLRLHARGLPNVEIVAQQAWPDYLAAQAGRRAAVFLAPLTRSRVNDGRAPVKAFDAARLGAACVFGDHPVFRAWVRRGTDGLLVEQTPAAFAEAALALLDDPDLRLALASAARDRLIALRAAPGALPGLAS